MPLRRCGTQAHWWRLQMMHDHCVCMIPRGVPEDFQCSQTAMDSPQSEPVALTRCGTVCCCACTAADALSLCAMGFGGRTVRCARAVRKVGYFGPVSPDGQGDCGNYCLPRHRTTQILTQSKNSDNKLNKLCFILKMPDFCLNLLFSPCVAWVVFRVVTGKLTHYRALCLRCAETPCQTLQPWGTFSKAVSHAGEHTSPVVVHCSCTCYSW